MTQRADVELHDRQQGKDHIGLHREVDSLSLVILPDRVAIHFGPGGMPAPGTNFSADATLCRSGV